MKNSDNPSAAKSSVKSGNKTNPSWVDVLGGMPPKKDIDAINKANTPKKAPGSVRV